MKLGVCAQALHHLPLDEGLAVAASLGFEAIELPVHRANPWIDLDAWLLEDADLLRSRVEAHGLTISALSIHQESQLLLGPHGEDTDGVYVGSPAEKVAFASARIIAAAQLAQRLGVDVLCGFVGCPAWHRTLPWPLADGWERGWPPLRERLLPLLDNLGALGVHFAHECHPNQQIYDLDTAKEALRQLDNHNFFSFNLDPANLVLADVDPVLFAVEMGTRVVHVHAKDAERVRHLQGRSGLLASGPWDRPGRGFRFRVPGWGQIPWRELITELHVADYQGVLAVEHEDPTLSRLEGLRHAAHTLGPLLLHEPREDRWW